jgi:hypothetical protein
VPAHCLENQLDAALRPDLALVLGVAPGEVCQRLATSHYGHFPVVRKCVQVMVQLRAAGVPTHFLEHGIDSHVLGIAGGQGHGSALADYKHLHKGSFAGVARRRRKRRLATVSVV